MNNIPEIQENKIDNSFPDIHPSDLKNMALHGFVWSEISPYVNKYDRGEMKKLFTHYEQENKEELNTLLITIENR